MGVIDNGNWGRAFQGTQFGTAQNNAIPTGEAWKYLLDLYNTYLPQASQNFGLGTSLLWSPNGLPGVTDSLTNFSNSIPGIFSNVNSGGNRVNDINGAMLDAVFGNTAQVNNAFSMFNQGSTQGQDLFNTGLSMFNSPYNQTIGDIGNYLMSTQGQNPYNSSRQDMANYGMKSQGWTDQLGRTNDAAMGLVNNQGVTDLIGQGIGKANSLMDTGMGATMAGLNYRNPILDAASAQALGIVGNQGKTDNTQSAINFFQNQLGQGLDKSNYNLQPGFDFAKTLMNGGGVSDYTKAGGDLALSYAMGGGPSIYSEMPSWLQNIASSVSVGGGGGGGGASIGMPSVDSGYTGSIDEILKKAKDILAQDPLLGMDKAINMARDQAATATSQQYQAAMSRALARGGGAGATVANGLQNRGMAEFADAGSQAEAAAMRDAAKTQQGLQLQKYGIGADLAKAMEQVAAQRNASSSSLAGSIAGANASLAAAGMNNSARAAELQASLNAQLAQAQMGLYGQLAGLNLNKMLAGLSGVGNFANQENEMRLAGLSAMPALQNSATARYAEELKKYGIDASALTGLTGQQTDLMKTGMNALPQLQNVAENAAIGRAGIGKDILGMGTNLFDSQSKLASNNLLGGLNASNDANKTAAGNLATWGNIGNQAAQNQLDWSKLGFDMSNTNVNNNFKLLDIMNGITKNNNDYQLGMGSLADKLWNTQINGLDKSAQIGLTQNKLDLDKAVGQTNAQNNAFGNMNNNMNNIIGLVNNSSNGLVNTMNPFMQYLNTAQAGMYGINPAPLSGQGWLGELAKAGIQGAAGAVAGGLPGLFKSGNTTNGNSTTLKFPYPGGN